MQLLGDVDLVPSDVVVGLVLVALRQKRERCLISAAHSESEPPSAERIDQAVLKDLLRLAPFANGIYGCAMNAIGESVYDGTSLVLPHKLVRALVEVLPCMRTDAASSQSHPVCCGLCCCWSHGSESRVEGDNCCLGHSHSLRRAVAGTRDVELLWGTWATGGGLASSHAPPFAVLLDHEMKELVITIRGTMSLKDCLIDAVCKPAVFDPLNLSAFDCETGDSEAFGCHAGLYAHAGMLSCLRDVR
ncbi:unnamed protein product, partial [Polarella glacialis]